MLSLGRYEQTALILTKVPQFAKFIYLTQVKDSTDNIGKIQNISYFQIFPIVQFSSAQAEISIMLHLF